MSASVGQKAEVGWAVWRMSHKKSAKLQASGLIVPNTQPHNEWYHQAGKTANLLLMHYSTHYCNGIHVDMDSDGGVDQMQHMLGIAHCLATPMRANRSGFALPVEKWTLLATGMNGRELHWDDMDLSRMVYRKTNRVIEEGSQARAIALGLYVHGLLGE